MIERAACPWRGMEGSSCEGAKTGTTPGSAMRPVYRDLAEDLTPGVIWVYCIAVADDDGATIYDSASIEALQVQPMD